MKSIAARSAVHAPMAHSLPTRKSITREQASPVGNRRHRDRSEAMHLLNQSSVEPQPDAQFSATYLQNLLLGIALDATTVILVERGAHENLIRRNH